jgi:hypothetical protein
MSQTLRIYWREYGTGIVGLEGGYGYPSGVMVREWTEIAAREYAKTIGLDASKIQTDREGGCHVIKTENHRAVGRCYFMADSPLQIPLGEGWSVLENGDGSEDLDIVVGFDLPDGRTVRLTWQPMTQDEIDAMHGNDEFGGWHNPTIHLGTGDVISLDAEPGETDAVMLMMMDVEGVERTAKRIEDR